MNHKAAKPVYIVYLILEKYTGKQEYSFYTVFILSWDMFLVHF